MSQPKYELPDVKNLFTDVETPILEFWKQNKIFEKSVSTRPESDHFVFYDGPPFVTGTPHYGHLLSSILKDIIPRYQTMLGKRVERVWGWDCHGLPVEEKVERTLGTKNRRDIENKVGVLKFIQECQSYVQNTSAEWPWYIDRIGRWVDMDKPYRTMDQNYMESVLWVFKQLYEKELVYKGKRVSLYCTRCGTPISNFEVAMDNSYAELEDPSVFVKFKLKYHKTGLGVGIVIKNEKGQILMMRRNEPGRETVWGIVGGKMDPEDTDIDATVRREMSEEIGIVPTHIEYYSYIVDVFEGRLFKTYHVVATIDKDPQQPAQDVATELKWVDVKDIPWDDIHIPTKNCLNDILNNKPSSEPYSNEKPDVYAIAWTTTPWTLPSNAAIAVDKEQMYVSLQETNSKDILIVAKERLKEVFKGDEYKIIDEFAGKNLVNLRYEPLFCYFTPNENDHHILEADFVSMGDGSGIVHIAPGYGEDDTELGKKNGLSIFDSINDEGKFIEQVEDYKDIYIKNADSLIIESLQKRELIFRAGTLMHSYPLCYRCSTPLIYKSQDAWYIDITNLRPQLEGNNENVNWVPEHIKHGRFLAGIKTAPDWGVSRTRYWATPMPIWECDNCEHRDVLGSIAEIEEKSGKKVTELHRPFIDEHTYSCEKCGKGTMKRIPEVLDCWLESASMPYAQLHYPFENKEKFENNFPGDYIVEYISQTRAWFYVTHVIATALFGTNAFKNVICTGTINGTDGRKMSKSYGNYPDPKITFERFGGDAIRLHLTDSVLSHGEDMNVSEEGISQQTRDIMLPLLNVYKYYALYANQHEFTPDFASESSNVIDKWVLARTKQATVAIQKVLSEYKVKDATREMKPLIDDISTWFIRRSRDRFVAGDTNALNTLFKVLYFTVKIFAPIIPFTTEFIYQKIMNGLPQDLQLESVHLHMLNDFEKLTDKEQKTLDTMNVTRILSSLALSIRDEKKLALKQPLAKLEVSVETKLDEKLMELIQNEINVLEITAIESKKFTESFVTKENESGAVALDIALTPELVARGTARELMRHIQVARRNAGLELGQKGKATVYSNKPDLGLVISSQKADIVKQTALSDVVFEEISDLASLKGEIAKVKQGEIEVVVKVEKGE